MCQKYVTKILMKLSLQKLEDTCKDEFTAYWKCLDLNNQQFFYCRDEENALNIAVEERLVNKNFIVGMEKAAVDRF